MMTDKDLRAFFVEFGEAVTAGDASRLAEAFAPPALILSDEKAVEIRSKAELKELFAGAAEAYRDRGVASTRADVVAVDRLTDRLIHAKVRWPYMDSDGNETGEEESTYIVWIDETGRPRIRVALPW
jgi:hypothetical protein